MKLKIDLKDPEYCDGCPCLNINYDPFREFIVCCSILKEDFGAYEAFDITYIKRPPKCIKENGL